jgi:radical SAM protein with 4Fe4S-binding SPASM domain
MPKLPAAKSVDDEQQESPFAMQIEMVEGCNLRCFTCALVGIRGKDNDYKFMTMEIAENIVDQILHLDWNPRIEFAMHGEPTMHPEAVEMAAMIRSKLGPNTPMMMTSNGGGLLKDTVKRVEGLLESLNVLALDWYENVNIVPKVLERLEGTSIAPRRYPQDLTANPHRRRKPTEHELVVIQDIATATKGTHAKLNNHAGVGSPPNREGQGKRCAKPFRELSIRWDGNVSVCCNDFRGYYCVGNVVEQGLEAVWNGAAMRAARRKLYHGQRDFGPCNGCDAVSYRTGLLPDKKGLRTLPKPGPEDEAEIRRALAGGPYTMPVMRPWELVTLEPVKAR